MAKMRVRTSGVKTPSWALTYCRAKMPGLPETELVLKKAMARRWAGLGLVRLFQVWQVRRINPQEFSTFWRFILGSWLLIKTDFSTDSD